MEAIKVNKKSVSVSVDDTLTSMEQQQASTPRYPVEVAPAQWMLPDRAGFLEWVRETFQYRPEGSDLFVQQRFVRDYVQQASPYKGLLLFHGLGVGKSCASIAAVEVLRAAGRQVVVMTPASLKRSYVEQVKLCGSPDFDPTAHKWSPVEGPLSGPRGWRRDPARGTDFKKLNAEDQDAIHQALSRSVKSTYTFVSYNGITAKRAAELSSGGGDSNYFDGKVVVIDEAHNFVSRVANNGLLASVYQRIMDSPTCKVILLSGTPLINRPNEIAYLVDLAQGYQRVVEVVFGEGLRNEQDLVRQVQALPGVDRAEVSDDSSRLWAKLLPLGFAKVAGKAGFVQAGEPVDASSVLQDVKRTSSQFAAVKKASVVDKLPLPVDNETFDETFVRYASRGDASSADFKGHVIVNTDILEKRIVGCVSFFSAYDPQMYPTVSATRLVRLPMSARQFAEYNIKRDEERKREETARKYARLSNKSGTGDDDSGSAQTYRAYSRSICNFVFPEGIARPYRADVKKMLDEASSSSQQQQQQQSGSKIVRNADAEADRTYLAELDKAMRQVEEKSDALQLDGRLEEHSPKFARIIRHIAAERKLSVVYSSFKAVEGVGLLMRAMRANGWGHIRAVRDDKTREPVFTLDRLPDAGGGQAPVINFMLYENEDEELSQLMLNVFNSDYAKLPPSALDSLAKIMAPGSTQRADRNSRGGEGQVPDNLHGAVVSVLLLSPSGAEGLNLRNVREVHLMEPFWHLMRIDQVIGRAVRAKSHLALPPAERKVDIYMYMTVFTPEQASTPTLQLKDGGLSSDEFVQGVARRKKRTIDSVLALMRTASVDCDLHRESHAKAFNYTCATALRPVAKGDVGKPAYRIRLEDDVADAKPGATAIVSAAKTMRVVKTRDGRELLLDPASGELYDAAEFKRSGQLISAGRLSSS